MFKEACECIDDYMLFWGDYFYSEKELKEFLRNLSKDHKKFKIFRSLSVKYYWFVKIMPLPKDLDESKQAFLQENLYMMQFLVLESFMQVIGEKIGGEKDGRKTMNYFFKFAKEEEKKRLWDFLLIQAKEELEKEYIERTESRISSSEKWKRVLDVLYLSRNIAHHKSDASVLGLFKYKRNNSHSFQIFDRNDVIKYYGTSRLQFLVFQKIFERNFLEHFRL